MMKMKGWFQMVFVMFCLAAFGGDEQVNEANRLYQAQQWEQASKLYQQIVAQSPENHRAWFRLANTHIQQKQGSQALKALKKAAENPQLPPALLHYARAQALLLNGDQDAMWQALDQTVTAGYRATATIEGDHIWSDIRDSAQFQAFMKGVDRNARPCHYDPRYGEFDFWLGSWDVYGNIEKTGPLYGRNTISKAENGCLITEQWVGSSGATGQSMNYYDGTLNQWVQHWVSANGTVINYSGGIKNGVMHLTGKIYYANASSAPQVRDFRGTWSRLEEGVVRQFFEESVDGGSSWYVWFDGYYFPASPQIDHSN